MGGPSLIAEASACRQGRDLHGFEPRRDCALDDAAEALVVEPFENVGDEARPPWRMRVPSPFGSAQEAARGAGKVDVRSSAGDH